MALLFAGIIALRVGDEPPADAPAVSDRQSATDRRLAKQAESGRLAAGSRERGSGGGETARRQPPTDEEEPAAARRRNRAGADILPPRSDAQRDSKEALVGDRQAAPVDGPRAGRVVNNDGNFRAAADALPEGNDDPAAGGEDEPAAEGDDTTSEEAAHAPPTTPVADDSITYDSGDHRFSLDSPFQIPHAGEAGTVALWLQPEWITEDNEDADVIELGDGLIRAYKNVNVLRFEVLSDNPNNSASLSIAEWQPGEWHSISATWENQRVTFYVDGQPVGKTIEGTFSPSGNTPVTIGTMAPSGQPVAPATVSDVSVRNRALPADEIERLYNRSAVPKSAR